jgi:hypothetical protein
MGEKNNAYRILVGKTRRDHWEEEGVGRWTISKRILETWDAMLWIGLMGLRIGTSGWL